MKWQELWVSSYECLANKQNTGLQLFLQDFLCHFDNMCLAGVIILKYISRYALMIKPVYPASNLPPCENRGRVPLGATTWGMPNERERFSGGAWRPKNRAKTPVFKSLLLCLDIHRKPTRASTELTWVPSRTYSSEGIFPGGPDRMFYAPEKEEVHDTYANSWLKVFTVVKSKCVHPSVYAWLEQIHCSLIRKGRFSNGLTNWGHSQFLTVYQLWGCGGGCLLTVI